MHWSCPQGPPTPAWPPLAVSGQRGALRVQGLWTSLSLTSRGSEHPQPPPQAALPTGRPTETTLPFQCPEKGAHRQKDRVNTARHPEVSE